MKPMPSSPAPYLPTSVDPADLVDPWLEISKNSLRWNVSEVRRLVGGIPIMAVVKGNAYGHGTVGVAHALEDAGVDRFAVVKVGEAVALREAGIEGEILNMGAFSPNEAETLVELGVSQSAFTNAVTDLAAAAAAIGRPARVHVKVGERVYPGLAKRVTDESQREALMASAAAKYSQLADRVTDPPPDVWVFRIDPIP